MAALTRDYETSRLAYQSLLDKKISAKMATDMERSDNSERFTVADPAREPSKPVKPRRLAYLAAAAVAALAAGLGLALGLEWRRNQFLGEWELPPHIRILGRIPHIRPAAKSAAALAVPFALATSMFLAATLRTGGLI
jgi:capsular polysaccharide biosynthesis protein